MKPRYFVLILVALALAACGASPDTQARPAAQNNGTTTIAVESKLIERSRDYTMPNVGEVAPDFQFTLADGSTTKLSDLRGKKVLINFWATWCAPCLAEMPDLEKAHQAYGDSVAIIGVNRIEQLDVIEPFAEELQISFPLVANPQGDISDRYGVLNLPITYFVNSDGTIGFRKLGVMNYDFITEHIDQLH
jgi:thiol-disulfide isomerase/thioredoxin